MIATVRFIGLMNAAVWFGAAVFATLGAGSIVSSEAMHQLLTPRHYPYFSGAISQLIAAKYWSLHLTCATVAILHVAAESLYMGRVLRKNWLALLLGLLVLGISEKAAIQPGLKRMHLAANAVNRSPADRKVASARYNTWRGVNIGFEVIMVLALGAYFWRVANPSDPTRFVSHGKYRG